MGSIEVVVYEVQELDDDANDADSEEGESVTSPVLLCQFVVNYTSRCGC